MLLEHGADYVGCIRFDDTVAAMRGRDFVEEVLSEALGAKHVVVGHDFRFGADRLDVGNLRLHVGSLGIELSVLSPVVCPRHGRISSTSIRAALAEGNFDKADDLGGKGAAGRYLAAHSFDHVPTTGSWLSVRGCS